MKTDNLHESPEAHPRVYHDVADDFLMTMGKMKFDEIAQFMQKVITENPELFFELGDLQALLTRTGNAGLRFDAIRVVPVKTISDATEVLITFNFSADGHLGSDHHEKRTISGNAIAIIGSPQPVVFQINNAEVHRNGDSGVALPDSESPQAH